MFAFLREIASLHCLTLKATGTQQLPRSGILLLCVRVGRPVRQLTVTVAHRAIC